MKKFYFYMMLLGVLVFQSTQAATFVVDNINNVDPGTAYTLGDGTNSLRKCIRLANALAGADVIRFNIAGAGPFIIASASTLAITETVLIDGFTQPGASAGLPLIQLQGINNNMQLLRFNAGSTGSTVRGLVFYTNNTTNTAIYAANGTSGHTFSGNYIGTDLTGTVQGGATRLEYGIDLDGATNCVIGGTSGTLTRNLISACSAHGLRIRNGANGTLIQGNYFGTTVTGNAVLANGSNGIDINNSHNQTIGGSTFSARNVMGGCQIGANISACTTLVVKGNFIGIGANGSTPIGNTNIGLRVQNNSSGITIGGPLRAERNVVSSNTNDGIQTGVNSIVNVTIQNNYIGFDSTGVLARGNGGDGIEVGNGSTILIGGSTFNLRNVIGNCSFAGIRITNAPVAAVIKGNFIGLSAVGGVAANNSHGIVMSNSVGVVIGGPLRAERNVLGSNGGDGLNLSAITGLTVQNNYIGFDTTGLVARNNNSDGIRLSGASSTVLIGGSSHNLRNVIGNCGTDGIRIGNATVYTTIIGNFVGLAANGSTAAGIGSHGIEINNTATVTIGGGLLPERNIVASCTQRGITINSSNPVTIQNNYVGTDSTGLIARGNLQRGISVNITTSLIIGGTSYNLRNVVAGNGQVGIAVDNSPGLIFKGNFVGLARNGTTAMGNQQHGVLIERSNGAQIGGPTAAERNVVASNNQRGFEINQSSSIVFVNNYVGLDSTGTLMRGNTQVGVAINNCSNATVGGTSANLRNIVSNNGFDGIRLDNSTNPVVQGNYVGVDITGLLNFGNGETGINIYNAGIAIVGGTTVAARNISSGNRQDGIFLHDNCAGSLIKGNFTGVGRDGTTIIGNGNSGIRVWGGITSNGIIIGGSTYAERNVSSANGATATSDSRDGIRLEGGAGGHVVRGNFCGTDSTGTLHTGYGNTWAGISINEVTGGIFGGTGTHEGNVSAGNGHEGIWLRNAVGNTIAGNYIGTDRTATQQMGNGQFGINIRFASLNNTIGGSGAERNTIAYTQSDAVDSSGAGVFVAAASRFNRITHNKIYCNDFLGIVLQSGANESIAAPSVTVADANSVGGTGSIDGDVIHVYHNRPPSGVCDCEGETYIGSAIVSGGSWSLTHGLNYSIPAAYDITATETTINGSTSQFSICNTALPVEFVSFTARKTSGRNILLQWSTAWEVNNNYFKVERRNAEGVFETIATVNGKGNSQGLSHYSAEDEEPLLGVNYYRITQVDFDGHFSSTAIRAIQVDGNGLQILLTTEGAGIVSPVTSQAVLSIYTELGQELLRQPVQLNANVFYPVSTGLARGLYLFAVSTGQESVWKKVPIGR